jgi:hypothetical protein
MKDESIAAENKTASSPTEDITEIQDTLDVLESLGQTDSEDYKTLSEKLKSISDKSSASSDEGDEDEDEDEEPEPGKKGKEKTDEGDEDEDEDEDEDDEEGKDDEPDIFGIRKKSKSKKEDSFKVESLEDLSKAVKTFGVDDVNTLLSSAKKWRADAQNYAKAQSELETINSSLSALPAKIKAAINAYAEDRDFESAFNDPSFEIDFNKSFEKQEKKIISSFFKSELEKLESDLDEGEIEEKDYQKEYKKLKDRAADKYEVKKEKFEIQRAKEELKAEKAKELFNSSVKSSVDELTASFPGFRQNELKVVESHLKGDNILELFFNQDGSVKKNAAKMLAMALYGEATLKSKVEKAKKDAKTEKAEEIFDKSKKTAKSKGGSAEDDQLESERIAKEMVGSIEKKNPFRG